MGPPAIAALTLAATVGGTVASVAAQRRSAKDQEEAQKLAQRQAAIENQRAVRQAIAAARQDRAQLIASGQAQTGGFSSSGIQGGVGAADTQIAANVGFARQTQAFSSAINQRLQRANRAQGAAGLGQAVAGLPGAFGMTVSGAIENLGSRSTDLDRSR